MSLILDGSVGVSDVDGSAATPAIRGTDANTGMFFPAADTIAFSEGGVESMRIDSSGNVGIGTSSPSAKLNVVGGNIRLDNNQGVEWAGGNNYIYGNETTDFVVIATNGNEAMRINSSGNVGIGTSTITSDTGWIPKLVLSATTPALVVKGSSGQECNFGISNSLYIDSLGHSTGTNNNIIFRNTASNSTYSATERMRITSAGQLLVGTTSWTGGGSNNSGIGIKTTSTSAGQFAFYVDDSNSSNILNVRCDGSTYNTTGVWGTISDQRLKENIVDATPKLDNLLQLKVRNFNFTNDENKTKQIGFVAQEIEQVFPSLVSEDAEGTKAVKTTVLLPMLVKAIQELKAELDSVKAELQTLKGS
jgi:hypothetical protein